MKEVGQYTMQVNAMSGQFASKGEVKYMVCKQQARDNLILLLDETYAMRVNAMTGLFANKGISCQPILQNVCQVPVYYGKGNSEDISYI